MTRLSKALILIAAVSTFYGAAAFLGRLDGDFKAAAVVTILALGGVVWQRERAWMAAYRSDVWARREREC